MKERKKAGKKEQAKKNERTKEEGNANALRLVTPHRVRVLVLPWHATVWNATCLFPMALCDLPGLGLLAQFVRGHKCPSKAHLVALMSHSFDRMQNMQFHSNRGTSMI